MRSGKGGGNICSHLPCTQAQFKVFRKCSNLVLMEKRLGMLLFHDLNYGNSSGKEKTWHVSMVSKYADPVGERHTHTNETILCAKDFRKKKKTKQQNTWGMKLSLPFPTTWFPDKCFRVADASVPNDSQIGLPHWSYRHSFHSSLTLPILRRRHILQAVSGRSQHGQQPTMLTFCLPFAFSQQTQAATLSSDIS